jgi:hypothetical protein
VDDCPTTHLTKWGKGKKKKQKERKKVFLSKKTRGVSHCGLAIYIKKYLKKVKEELWKLNYISSCKNIVFKKIL